MSLHTLFFLSLVCGWIRLPGALAAPLEAPKTTPPFAAQAPLAKWVYCSRNLWVDDNIQKLELLFRRAARSGYTHVLIADSKFGKLGDMDARYFRNVDRVKVLARELNLELVPALFPIGYSNDLLWHDPNLIEALPVREAAFAVTNGVAVHLPDPDLKIKGGDFENLQDWDWKDATVIADAGAALVKNPGGQNARIVQKLKIKPFRQYHLSVRIKTEDFRGTPEIKILAGSQRLNFDSLNVKPAQPWTVHHVVFNSLSNSAANLYVGCWGGRSGSVWFDDLQLRETALVNLVRRPGAPLAIRSVTGQALIEGTDFQPISDPKMGRHLWPGSYDVWHEPPVLHVKAPDGSRLRVSFYHGATVHEDQAVICPSEPKTVELLRDQARRMHAAWGAKGYMMSHDEIRVWNWCGACQARGLDAGALLADNVRTCVAILREVNPSGRIYVWSDMFDPNHNAHGNYYLAKGSFIGSWNGLDPEVTIVPWYFDKRRESLAWFAGRGHRQVIAGYYDSDPARVRQWLQAAEGLPGIEGVMYTTWQSNFADLEKFNAEIEAIKPR